jgi:hypothetical protein
MFRTGISSRSHRPIQSHSARANTYGSVPEGAYYYPGRKSLTSRWQSASDEDWALALAREAVIRPLTDQPEVTEELVVTASAELGISRSMVYRLVAKFRNVTRSQVYCQANEDVKSAPARCP